MKRIKMILGLVAALCLLTGCHLERLSQRPIPEALKTVFVQSDDPYTTLTQSIKNMLRSDGIQVSDHLTSHTLIIDVSDQTLTHNTPSISTSSFATTYTYTKSFTAQLLSPKGLPLLQKSLFLARSEVILNADQVYAPAAANVADLALSRELSLKFLYYLLSTDTRTKLTTALHAPQGTAHGHHQST